MGEDLGYLTAPLMTWKSLISSLLMTPADDTKSCRRWKQQLKYEWEKKKKKLQAQAGART